MSTDYRKTVVDKLTVIEAKWRDRFNQHVQEKVNKLTADIERVERAYRAVTGDEDER